MPQFDESADGQSAELAAGDSFVISLHENPTTGYRWNLNAGGDKVCTLTSDDFEPGRLPGGEGVHRWHFRAAQAGEVKIEFALRRGWTPAAKSAKSFTLQVKVNP